MSIEDSSGGVMVFDPISSLTHHLFDMKLSIETYTERIDAERKTDMLT